MLDNLTRIHLFMAVVSFVMFCCEAGFSVAVAGQDADVNTFTDPNGAFFIPDPPRYFENESDKAEFVKKAVKNNIFTSIRPGYRGEADRKFCNRFLEDFISQQNFVYVEPVVKTKRFIPSVFEPYIAQCPSLDLRKRGYLDGIGIPQFAYGRSNAKLYQEDFDGDASNGLETVFFVDDFVDVGSEVIPKDRVEKDLAYLESRFGLGRPSIDFNKRYALINTKECKIETDIVYGGYTGSVSAIVFYEEKNNVYVYKFTPFSYARNMPERELSVWEVFPDLPTSSQGMRSATRKVCAIH